MKKQTEAKSSRNRIVEMILLAFIPAFVARATPNLDMLPRIPWADDQPNDIGLGNTDDKDWGNYATHGIPSNPSTSGKTDVEASFTGEDLAAPIERHQCINQESITSSALKSCRPNAH